MGILQRLGLGRIFGWLRDAPPATAGIDRHGVGPRMSQAVKFHHWIYLSGVTADDDTPGIKEQTAQVLAKIDKHLALADSDKSKLLSATIFLSDISLRPEMDAVWNGWIDPDNPPARTCVKAQLAGNTQVEIVAMGKD